MQHKLNHSGRGGGGGGGGSDNGDLMMVLTMIMVFSCDERSNALGHSALSMTTVHLSRSCFAQNNCQIMMMMIVMMMIVMAEISVHP